MVAVGFTVAPRTDLQKPNTRLAKKALGHFSLEAVLHCAAQNTLGVINLQRGRLPARQRGRAKWTLLRPLPSGFSRLLTIAPSLPVDGVEWTQGRGTYFTDVAAKDNVQLYRLLASTQRSGAYVLTKTRGGPLGALHKPCALCRLTPTRT